MDDLAEEARNLRALGFPEKIVAAAIIEQQLWGYAAVRNAKLTGSDLTKTMLLNVLMGVMIITLKVAVGH